MRFRNLGGHGTIIYQPLSGPLVEPGWLYMRVLDPDPRGNIFHFQYNAWVDAAAYRTWYASGSLPAAQGTVSGSCQFLPDPACPDDGNSTPTSCQGLGFECCSQCAAGPHPEHDLDCVFLSCCEVCSGCGDGTCDASESCATCAQDCLDEDERCCSGIATSGDCCGDGDCPSAKVCVDYVCTDTLACVDADGDGYGISEGCSLADCDDTRAEVHQGAPERCNGIDDDCDGEVDEEWPDLGTSCVVDAANPAAVGTVNCLANGLGSECCWIEDSVVDEDPVVGEERSGPVDTLVYGGCRATPCLSPGLWLFLGLARVRWRN